MKPEIKNAFKFAFIKSIPILAGFSFLGISFGIYFRSCGFPIYFTLLTTVLIYAGSIEFLLVSMLLGPFSPLNVLFLTLMINSRQIFYAISMLDKYRHAGKFKKFLISGMVDESFSINYITEVPKDVDKNYFMFFITILLYFYWISGSLIGATFYSVIDFNLKGIDFVMTALFIVIFIGNWQQEKAHESSILGLCAAALSLAIFGPQYFIIPTLAIILIELTIRRKVINLKYPDKNDSTKSVTDQSKKNDVDITT